MDVADRVRLKSDRPGRALVLFLCVAPVAAPLLAAGLNAILQDAPPAARQTPADSPHAGLRAAIIEPADAVFAPEPVLGAAASQLEPKSARATQAAVAPTRWRATGSHVLRAVSVLEGLRLQANGMVISIDGVAPTPVGSECKRLDGVVEPCAARAVHRLEILTRGRPVVCDLRENDAGEARGACRAGKIDLADDLLRNGLAVRAGESS